MAEPILKALTVPEDKRPRHTFKIPIKERQWETDPTTITFVGLRVSEEQDAAKVAEARGGSVAVFQMELIRRSVIAVNGKSIDWGAGADGWLEQCSPKVRDWVRVGYRRVNERDGDLEKDFFAGEVVEQG